MRKGFNVAHTADNDPIKSKTFVIRQRLAPERKHFISN